MPGCRESAEKRGNCSEPPATRRKARATSWRTTTEQSCCQFFFCHRRRLHTLTVSAPSSPSRHGIAVAGWGPRYFPLLLNSISGCDFPWFASLLPRLCGSKSRPGQAGQPPTGHSQRPTSPYCVGLFNHTPQAGSASIRQTNDSGVPVHRVCMSAPRVAVEEQAVAISRWSPRRIQIPGGALDDGHPQRILPVGCKRDLGPVPRGRWRSMAVGRRVARAEGNQRETGAEDDGDAAIRSEEPVQTLPAHHQGAASAVLHHRPSSPCPLVSHPGPWGSPPQSTPFPVSLLAPCANPRGGAMAAMARRDWRRRGVDGPKGVAHLAVANHGSSCGVYTRDYAQARASPVVS